MDLPIGTFVFLSDKKDCICFIERETDNGIVFLEYASWKPAARFFRYRTGIHEMVILDKATEVKNFILRAFGHHLHEGGGRVFLRAPTSSELRGFRNRWGMEWLVLFLMTTETFKFRPSRKSWTNLQAASVSYLTKVVTDRHHRRSLATKAHCPEIRKVFASCVR